MKNNITFQKKDITIITHRHFLLHKPFGTITQFKNTKRRKKVVLGDHYDFPEKTMAIGRLDVHSEGLLFLTTDGKMSQHVRGRKVEKEYHVQLDGEIDEAAIETLKKGVIIGTKDGKYLTKPCEARRLIPPPVFAPRSRPVRDKHRPSSWAAIILREGKNRQVRKMTAAVGFPTIRLIRVRIGNVHLGDLQQGEVIEVPSFDV